uniref:Uncharacterized protein n=1 Tax=Anopheles coluzzii TaxID=1518534 RepID=A0A6E8WDH7_ANOCL|nr:uncharacterized protein LOC120955061 [Anopheles coluzzii]XP_040231472.2 uncharacterized protein LOC120955061 [Anopheles coluzzii]XP_040231473.2 uncharacterized protein LOC120955061 [Anopheles coluzzii]
MPPSTQGRGAAVSQLPVPERKPDYYIGPTGRPVLTMGLDRTSPGTCDSANGTGNSKLNKCLYNLTIRNAGYPTSNNDRHGSVSSSNSRRVSNKTEHDITSAPARGHCSKSPPQISGSGRFGTAPDTGGRRQPMVSTAGGWSSTAAYQKPASSGICGPSPPAAAATRLLAARSSGGGTRPQSEATGGSRPGSLVLQQQCRYSNHHKQLDNRLSYQRSYDRNIFGYDKPSTNQIVLPPLQI